MRRDFLLDLSLGFVYDCLHHETAATWPTIAPSITADNALYQPLSGGPNE
jgi:hypothetical protein